MVQRCAHRSPGHQSTLLHLFSKYSELFSGALGRVPGPTVKLKLKKDAFPFYSRAYTVPKAVEHIVKKEVKELEDINVLEKILRQNTLRRQFSDPTKWWNGFR